MEFTEYDLWLLADHADTMRRIRNPEQADDPVILKRLREVLMERNQARAEARRWRNIALLSVPVTTIVIGLSLLLWELR
jgi:hypothetical protein